MKHTVNIHVRGEDGQSVEILPHHIFKFYVPVVYEGRESESLDGGGNYPVPVSVSVPPYRF
jgi:hypothetical protein